MKVLIISCTTGEGHNSCARAIKEIFDLNNEPCDISDGLSFISPSLSKFAEIGHIILYRHFPKIFNLGYSLSEKNPSFFAPGSIVYKIFSKGTLKLKNYILENGYDAVICTHPFAAVILTEMQNRYKLSIKTAFVATDYTRCPSVEDSALDYYFIPDKKLCDEFVCKNITPDKIYPFGIPIKQKFYNELSKNEAKEKLGILPENRHIVMMCGSMGCGPLSSLAAAVSQNMNSNTELTVICGTNNKLKNALENTCGKLSNVHILGFTNDMPTVLARADLYLTKPGGISTTEAAIKKIPMLFVNTVAACETYNLAHFTEYGVAYYGRNVKDLKAKCLGMINDSHTLDEISLKLNEIEKINSAEKIREILKRDA
ncbi:MAG: polysaccharide biosynthesis protein [Clostridia bacterium]|nr:polysaccharide biosynthesis protein [Clostridia bacterium]